MRYYHTVIYLSLFVLLSASADISQHFEAGTRILSYTNYMEILPTTPPTLIAFTYSGFTLWKSTDNGDSWEEIILPLRDDYDDVWVESISFNPFDFNTALLITKGYPALVSDRKFYKTIDGGDTWFEIDSHLENELNRIAYHPNDSNKVIGASYHQVYKSDDAGRTFKLTFEGNHQTVGRFYFNSFDPDIIYFNAVFSYGIMKSTDTGESWISASEGLSNNGELYSLITDIAIVNSQELYCTQRASHPRKGGLFKSTNSGQQWIEVDSSLSKIDSRLSMSGVAINPTFSNRIYVSLESYGEPGTQSYSNGGLFFTDDAGKTWDKVYDGPVDFVEIDNANPPNVYFNTEEGLMRLTDTLTVSVNEGANIPKQFVLQQNYPNPFNPTTTIKFSIPPVERSGTSLYNAQLIVYDILGREVATLVNKPMSPGNYEVKFDATGLSSGVYFYRLNVGDFSNVKKMVILK